MGKMQKNIAVALIKGTQALIQQLLEFAASIPAFLL